MGHTVQRPGGDAAVVLVESGKRKALALTTDCTPRYCEADPPRGGMQAVAESWRNLTAVGALPLAVTDNLNFGNPERPGDHGPVRRLHSRHRRRRAARSTTRSSLAMCRFTTRPTARVFSRHRRLAVLGYRRRRQVRLARTEARRQLFDPHRRDRRVISAARSICANCSAARMARRRRSISRLSAGTGILSASEIAPAGSTRATISRMAGFSLRLRKWRWRAVLAPLSINRRLPYLSMLIFSARTRRATSSKLPSRMPSLGMPAPLAFRQPVSER